MIDRHRDAKALAKIEADIQRAALNPDGGWWRPSKRGHGLTLRRDVVLAALSVGCTTRQIATASGAPLVRIQVNAAVAKNQTTRTTQKPSRWPAILEDAVARKLPVHVVAAEQNVQPRKVWTMLWKFSYGTGATKGGAIVRRDNKPR